MKVWSTIKWFFSEILKIYSNEPSYFSKKRIESGVAFLIAQVGMVYFFTTHLSTLTMGEFLLWASAEFAVAGYLVNKIQNEKLNSEETATSDSGTPQV